MKTFIASVAAVGMATGLATAAGPVTVKSGGGHTTIHTGGGPVHTGAAQPGRVVTTGNYHTTYGNQFSSGYYYPGRSHSHWTYSGYSSRYGCTCYWCPYTCCYYYWYQPANCYYPVSYFAQAPVVAEVPAPLPIPAPVQVAPPIQTQYQTQIQTQTQTQTQIQGPPAGVPPLPR